MLTATKAEATRPQISQQWLEALRTVRGDLLNERNEQGYWVGELCSSPLSTATAISALAIAEQRGAAANDADNGDIDPLAATYRGNLSELMLGSLEWLAAQQNDDGGWGDTDRSGSNLATTMLVLAAFRLTCVPAKYADLEPRAEEYLRKQGGVAGLRKRYGKDKTFAAPILANAALAGIVPWRQVPTLPFELAAMPQKWFKWLRLPVVSYAIPALVGIGLAKFHHRPTKNPVARWIRRTLTDRCLALVERMQPDSGGFLEATPLTSFVVMSLASTGRCDHPVVRRGVEFLLASARGDGSWPIDTNLACWNTSLALNALAAGGESVAGSQESGGELHPGAIDQETASDSANNLLLPTPDSHLQSLDWLLACQHTERHPFTDAEPGGWAWTNLSGGVPDADDTPGALLTLSRAWPSADARRREAIAAAGRRALRWLLDLQNEDGGWPTFCRGWGKLPFDRSATDLTAHALRAIDAWRALRGWQHGDAPTDQELDAATQRGLTFLNEQQVEDGSWRPLWFGNEHRDDQSNPVYGTARVLLALNQLSRRRPELIDTQVIECGVAWILGEQHASGGWGSSPDARPMPVASVEETSVAVEALLATRSESPVVKRRIESGVDWLVDAIDRGEHRHPTPIGLYFAKLWYYERMYPLVFATSALGAACRRWQDSSNAG